MGLVGQSNRRYVLSPMSNTCIPVTDEAYWRWHGGLDVKKKTCLGMKIERSEFSDSIVSTVFLGISQGYEASEPLLFETYVRGGKYNGWLKRYTSYEKAVKGHKIVSSRVSNDSSILRIDG